VGQYGRIPDPFDALRKQAPRTGPPVQNMGGTPTQAPTPAVKTVVPSPAVASGPPGPTGAALPSAPPLTLPAPPPGYQPPAMQGAMQPPPGQPPAMQGTVVKKTETTTAPTPAAPAAPQPAAPGGPYQVIGSRPQMPDMEELNALGTGHGITTPHGDVFRAADGRLMLQLNDQGKQAYEEERARKLSTFGHYPGHDDPGAPPPPLTPGLPSFNPFTGQWSE
jgi:hypothetical protein